MHPLLNASQKLLDGMISHRRRLHQNPEVGLELPGTREYVGAQLRDLGYEPIPLGSSLVATVGRGRKTFLLRADMDALPIFEQTGLDYASDNGFMHACGHDMHTAMLLGAAALLKDQEDTLPGVVKLFFQAGEETMEGAREAVELGLLDGVDAAAMLHVYSGFPIPSGMVSVSGAGPCCASVDWFRIEIAGTGGHGAMPEVTVNPIGIASAIYQAIQELVSTRVPASQQAVMTVGAIGGGDAANIIPDTAWMSGTIRTFDEAQREALKQQLSQIAAGISNVWGGSAQVSFSSSAPCVVSDGKVSQSALVSLRDLLGAEQALDMSVAMGGKFARTMGSEDFAYIARKVPSVMLRLMAGSQQEGYVFSNHHPQVTYKEDVMPIGAAAYAKVAMDWLQMKA